MNEQRRGSRINTNPQQYGSVSNSTPGNIKDNSALNLNSAYNNNNNNNQRLFHSKVAITNNSNPKLKLSPFVQPIQAVPPSFSGFLTTDSKSNNFYGGPNQNPLKVLPDNNVIKNTEELNRYLSKQHDINNAEYIMNSDLFHQGSIETQHHLKKINDRLNNKSDSSNKNDGDSKKKAATGNQKSESVSVPIATKETFQNNLHTINSMANSTRLKLWTNGFWIFLFTAFFAFSLFVSSSKRSPDNMPPYLFFKHTIYLLRDPATGNPLFYIQKWNETVLLDVDYTNIPPSPPLGTNLNYCVNLVGLFPSNLEVICIDPFPGVEDNDLKVNMEESKILLRHPNSGIGFYVDSRVMQIFSTKNIIIICSSMFTAFYGLISIYSLFWGASGISTEPESIVTTTTTTSTYGKQNNDPPAYSSVSSVSASSYVGVSNNSRNPTNMFLWYSLISESIGVFFISFCMYIVTANSIDLIVIINSMFICLVVLLRWFILFFLRFLVHTDFTNEIHEKRKNILVFVDFIENLVFTGIITHVFSTIIFFVILVINTYQWGASGMMFEYFGNSFQTGLPPLVQATMWCFFTVQLTCSNACLLSCCHSEIGILEINMQNRFTNSQINSKQQHLSQKSDSVNKLEFKRNKLKIFYSFIFVSTDYTKTNNIVLLSNVDSTIILTTFILSLSYFVNLVLIFAICENGYGVNFYL